MGNIHFFSNGIRISGKLYLPDTSQYTPPYPGVIVCHGFGSRKENQTSFCTFLAEHGFAVLGFDFRGHGDSEGMLDEHAGEDVLSAIDYIAAQPNVASERMGIRGSSMGGFFALRAGAASPRIKAVTAIAPAHDTFLARGVETGRIQQLLEREKMQVRIDAASFVRGIRLSTTQDALNAFRPRALLLIQCKGDDVVPYQWTQEIYAQASEPKRILLIENGSHTFAQQDLAAHQSTLEWFQQHL